MIVGRGEECDNGESCCYYICEFRMVVGTMSLN